MNSIIPKSITDLIKKSNNIDQDLLYYLTTNYGEFLLAKNIKIVGIYHTTVHRQTNHTKVNYLQDGLMQTTPLYKFFFEKLCAKQIRKHQIESILYE